MATPHSAHAARTTRAEETQTFCDEPHLLTEERINEVRAMLPDSDGEPMDSPWHRDTISLLIESVVWHNRDRNDYFVGGNTFLYYSMNQAKGHDYKGPDFFYVNHVDGTRRRRFWWVFEEDGRFPDVILELLSESTKKEDRTTKKSLYEKKFRVPEYIMYDPQERKLEGLRLVNTSYKPIAPNSKGWIWSEQLGLWVGEWDGFYIDRQETWLRFYLQNGKVAPVRAEARELELKRQKRRTLVEKERADRERRRADDLQAELTRLKAMLAKKEKTKDSP